MKLIGKKRIAAIALTMAMGCTAYATADNSEINSSGVIDITNAIAIAQTAIPGNIVEAELEKEHGVIVWEIEIKGHDGNTHEVKIDATTSKIISAELDD